jgi:hypothetical protein
MAPLWLSTSRAPAPASRMRAQSAELWMTRILPRSALAFAVLLPAAIRSSFKRHLRYCHSWSAHSGRSTVSGRIGSSRSFKRECL